MGHQLYAVVYLDSWKEKTKAGKDKKRPTTFRGFTEATPDRDDEAFIENELSRLVPQWAERDVLPSEDIPLGNKTKEPLNYGMEKWAKMFNPRQRARAWTLRGGFPGLRGRRQKWKPTWRT